MLVSAYRRDDSDDDADEISGSKEVKNEESTFDINLASEIKTLPGEVNPLGLSKVNSERELVYNLKYEVMRTAKVGPKLPKESFRITLGEKNTLSGYIEDTKLNPRVFEHQLVSFINEGKALAPDGREWIYNTEILNKRLSENKKDSIKGSGDLENNNNNNNESQDGLEETKRTTVNTCETIETDSSSNFSDNKNNSSISEISKKKRKHSSNNNNKRNPRNDPSNVFGYLGTWSNLDERYSNKSSDTEKSKENNLVEDHSENNKIKEGSEPSNKKNKILEELKSIWHGATGEIPKNWTAAPKKLIEEANSRIEVPVEALPSDIMKLLKNNGLVDPSTGLSIRNIKKLQTATHLNKIPKRFVVTWTEAQKGVSKARFFPKYGHLVLASSLDHAIRIYDVYDKRKCQMDYLGHHHGVRDIDWNPQGDQFLSCSYDRSVLLWDTQTGKVIQKYQDEKNLPNCVRFYPKDPNVFLVGQVDKKINQWDVRSNEIVQEYKRHLGSINTFAFFDDCRRFISTSDDKSIRIWEYNVPVDIKYIADPSMHSISCVVLHPNNKYLLCQSLDNKISIYSTKDRFKKQTKFFKGHINAGYGCDFSVSPDGRFVSSGDSHGRIFHWDWKTSRVINQTNAHQGVVVDVQWHPLDPSRIVSASWNGGMKLWD